MLQKMKDFATKNKKYLLIGACLVLGYVFYQKYRK